LTLRWVPGHEGVHGNEEVDKAAKVAGEGRNRNSPRELLPKYLRNNLLPFSLSAIKQAHRERTHTRWTELWSTSPRFQHIHHIDPLAIKRSFIKLTSSFSKRLTGLIIGLRTRHLPLNQHLFRLTKIESPDCPHFPHTEETVPHFLFECPHYLNACQIMSQALGRKSTSLSHILTDSEAITHLVRYVNQTRRLKSTLGEISLPKA
ncbi:hypothetical protein BDR06DRAFT_900569, partial [Suillus hirtellus]